jgi:hypothetical protein
MTAISAGLSTAAMILAASTIFSLDTLSVSKKMTGSLLQNLISFVGVMEITYHVLPMLRILIPSGRVFHRYGSM